MSDSRDAPLSRLGGHSVIYAVSSVFGQLGSLVTFPLYTRALGPASYGILAIGLAASGVLKTLVIAGTNTALMNSRIGAKKTAARQAAGAAIVWVTLTSALLGLIWWLFGAQISSAVRLGEGSLVFGWSVIAFVFVDSLLELMLSCARAATRPRLYALANALKVVITLVTAIWLLIGFRLGASGAIVSMAIASLCATVWLWWELQLKVSLGAFSHHLGRLVSEGAPLVPANLGSWVTDLADRYLLLFITGSAVLVGVYSAGYRVGSLITVLFVSPFHTAYLPFMLEHAEHERAETLYAETSRLFLGFGAGAVLLLQAVALPLVRVLAGTAYLSSVRIVGIVALGCLLGGAAMLMTPKALRERRTSTLALAFGAGAVVNVAMNLVVIPSMKMYGAALATLVAYAVVLAVMLAVTPKSARPPGIGAELWRVLPVTTVATMAAGFDLGGGLTQGLVAFGTAAAGLVLLVLFGAIRVADLSRVSESLVQAWVHRERRA